MKPNLFIVGAPKCGSSAWVEYLGTHPDIGFSRRKEPHYFTFDFPNWRMARTLDEYLDLFEGCAGAKVRGEASVRQLYSKVAAREIYKFNPDAKILILLRDQEDFLPSLHNQQLYNRDESITDFERAWRLSGKRDSSTIPSSCRVPQFLDYAAMGCFHEQVERYFSTFPAEQIRVLNFQDWISDAGDTYRDILQFLGVEDNGRTDFPPVNEAKHHKSRLIAALTQNPAPALLRVSAFIKRLIRRKELGLAEPLRRLNRGAGYRTQVRPALKEEIRRHYEEDNKLLASRLKAWRA